MKGEWQKDYHSSDILTEVKGVPARAGTVKFIAAFFPAVIFSSSISQRVRSMLNVRANEQKKRV